jgi:hypothetical protein
VLFSNLVHEGDKESPSEPEVFLFYLNAFLIAGENVRCFLEEDYGYEEAKGGRGAPCRIGLRSLPKRTL